MIVQRECKMKRIYFVFICFKTVASIVHILLKTQLRGIKGTRARGDSTRVKSFLKDVRKTWNIKLTEAETDLLT